jgi:hypothetical protein
MKAKTLLELLTLSTNVYMISKDEKFMENLKEMTEKGKAKLASMHAECKCGQGGECKENGEEKLIEKFMHKAHQAKEELEEKIEDVAKKVYDKINIAHAGHVKKLEEQLEMLKKELAVAGERIANMETHKK